MEPELPSPLPAFRVLGRLLRLSRLLFILELCQQGETFDLGGRNHTPSLKLEALQVTPIK